MAKKIQTRPTPAPIRAKTEGKKPYSPEKSAEYLAKVERRGERGGQDEVKTPAT